jgi:hypothetical protein
MATSVVLTPNFLASEVGLVLKTIGLDAVTNATLVEKGVIKAGTVIANKGIIFQDVDVTGSTASTQVPAPIMVGGYYIASKLSTTEGLSSVKGLIAIEEGSVTRPY